MRSTLWIALISSGMSVLSLTQQAPTVPERIARGENPVYLSLTREIVEPSLSDIVASSSLIVDGTIEPVKTYLSEDKRWVYTDYRVNPTLVVFQEKTKMRATLGQEPLILKVGGGKLTLDGVQVLAVDENLEPLSPNEQVILFLTESKGDPGKYELVLEVSGAFAVTRGKIRPLLKGNWMLKNERGNLKGDFLNRVYHELDKRPR